MHSTKENAIKWKDEFDTNLYFPNGKSNSWGVLPVFSGSKTFTVKKRLCDENGRVLILEIWMMTQSLSFFNFYNANTESEQIQTSD